MADLGQAGVPPLATGPIAPRWAWLALALLVLVAGCKSMTSKPLLQVRGPEQVLAEAPPTERTFVWASGGAEFLDPALVSESAGHHLMLNCFVGAYQYNRGDGPPVPALASHHEVTADGLTWTIHLRPGIVWSDGKPIEAEDFVWSWRRVLAPQTASRAAQLLWFVAGAKAYNEGSDPDPAHVGVRALDSQTLQVQLAEPVAFFDHLLAEMPYAPTPRHVVDKFGTAWTEPDHIVVSGPFTLSHYESRKRAELKKNPKFIDAAEVWLDKVVVLDTESERTALDWYEVGRTHWLGDVSLPMDQVPALRTAGRPDFRTEKKLCSYYFSLRMDQPALRDVRVRQALALTVDKERLALHILQGGQPVADNAVPDLFRKTHGYIPPKGLGYDPARGRQLLADAGYPQGLGLPPIELLHNTGEGHRIIAEFVQRSWQENLGVRIELLNMEWGTLLKTLQAGDFAIGRSSWCADYPDPLTFLEVFHSQSPSNYSGYKSATYDGLLQQIRSTARHQDRNPLITQAEELLMRELPLLPMYHYTSSTLVKPWVLGLEPNLQDMHPMMYVRFADATQWAQIQRGQAVHLPPLPGPPSAELPTAGTPTAPNPSGSH